MNERIKELAKRALEETQLMMIMEYKNFESKLYEKFAELIVRECCQKLEDDGMVEIAIEMKQHFGVEE